MSKQELSYFVMGGVLSSTVIGLSLFLTAPLSGPKSKPEEPAKYIVTKEVVPGGYAVFTVTRQADGKMQQFFQNTGSNSAMSPLLWDDPGR